MEDNQLTLGIGTRLQHTQFGPGVIIGVKYATYLISFINHGTKEIDKTDNKLDEIIPENTTLEVETASAVEKSLLKIYGNGAIQQNLFRWAINGSMACCCCNRPTKHKSQKKYPLMCSFIKL